MSIANHNKGGITWNVDTKDFEYHSLKELQEQLAAHKADYAVLYGVFINKKSKFGDAPVAIIEDCYINLPDHLADVVKEILADPDSIDQIKAGKAGIKVRTYEDETYGRGTCYTAEFIDL